MNMARKWILLTTALGITAPVTAALPMRYELGDGVRLELASQAREACARQGFDVAVAVADSHGTVRTLQSSDAVSPLAIKTARRKARSAVIVGFPTSGLVEADKEAPPYTAMLRQIYPDTIFLGGGVPVRAHGQIVGAVGVGGSPRPESDERCAKQAIEAIDDRLE